MKMCKNDKDVILYTSIKCYLCKVDPHSFCSWGKTVNTIDSINCGGISVNSLSDIFKL